jgi:hypothetical protein
MHARTVKSTRLLRAARAVGGGVAGGAGGVSYCSVNMHNISYHTSM